MSESGGRSPGLVAGLVASARPRQWVKNLTCFAGLVFSNRLLDGAAVGRAAWSFAGFCLASSSIYLINDVCDRRADAANPRKRLRPVASGAVPVPWALATALALAAAAMASTSALPQACAIVLGVYLAMFVGYSLRLKHTVLLDVILIALGFVLRVLHGVFALGVAPSPWIVLCMFFLALFLGFAKRRSELVQDDGGRSPRRPVLEKYRTTLLDLLLGTSAVMAINCYALYTVLGRPGNETLVMTVPLVVYGFYRYLLLALVFDVGEAPERDLFADPPLIAAGVAWVMLCVAILYLNLNFIHAVGPAPTPPAPAIRSR